MIARRHDLLSETGRGRHCVAGDLADNNNNARRFASGTPGPIALPAVIDKRPAVAIVKDTCLGVHTTDNAGAVGDRLLGMEGTLWTSVPAPHCIPPLVIERASRR